MTGNATPETSEGPATPDPDSPRPREETTACAKSYALLFLKILVAAGLLVLVISSRRMRNIDWPGLVDRIREWPRVGAALVMICLIPLIGTTRWHLLLKCLGCQPSFRRTLHLHLSGTLFNCIGLGYAGGDLAKAGYLFREERRGRRAEVVYATLFDRAVGLFSLLLVGIAVMGANLPSVWKDTAMRVALQAMGIAAAVLVTGFLLLRPSASPPELADTSLVRRLLLALRTYRAKYAIVLATTGLSVMAHAVTVMVLFLLGRALGMPAILPSKFVFCVIAGLAFSSLGPLMGTGFGQFAFAKLFEYEWGGPGYQFGVFLATLYQVNVLCCNLALGLPAFLTLHNRGTRVEIEAVNAQDPEPL